ncbi:DUF1127 domain-containing protein [Blastochloris viridis]|uniref:YjiS-like domain-containing protein n=1 Tax=Blastochloris viridis TaxID=1079 RepID=A0A0H5BB65_BLAVI|nr:DUF1127 domain-containing protein [Blastochloris viridis]ALK10549.1 hypothetical protein BVIR_2784 [Blastochloris viridis]BAR99497.1 hypothetical protein BV133_1904 [Blastochloris viridis]CUU43211.1 hypothetical protein BVIRIDIS_22280 [Blastochloris viridis]
MTIARAPSAAHLSQSLAATFIHKLAQPILAVVRALEARRQIAQMAALSDIMLKDIGLQRQDLQDAASLSPFSDPTRLLVSRVSERRAARLQARPRP